MSEESEFVVSVRKYYIYVIHLATIANEGLPIIKFGRTHDVLKRFRGYPKNSTLMYLCRVRDSYHVEDEIYSLFKEHFKQEVGYGKEYFSGDSIRGMIDKIERLIFFMKQKLDDDYVPIMNSYKNHFTFKISSDDELDQYIEAVEGVKVDGDVQVVDDEDGDVEVDKVKVKVVKKKLVDGGGKKVAEKGGQFKCEDCNNVFKSKQNYLYHLNKNVCKKGNYSCRYCARNFTTHNSMYRHMKHTCKIKKEKEDEKNQIFERLVKLESESKTKLAKLEKEIASVKKQVKSKKSVKDG